LLQASVPAQALLLPRFAKSYPIALLARSPETYESLVQEINSSGGQAIGINTDVSSEESVQSAFTKIEREFKSAGCAAAVFNASAPPARKPLLEMSVEDFSKNWNVSAYVLSLVVFHPSQKIQP
jgi:NAD(P)-dependent dehydrogenase (short-subunit alcohol dehydrogenase family)